MILVSHELRNPLGVISNAVYRLKIGLSDADEYIEVVTLPLDRALAMVRSGQISDAKTIAGLLLTAVDL